MSRRYATVVLFLLVACDAGERLIGTQPEPLAARFGTPAFVVGAGESIQAAVDAAAPGSVIQLEPGVYEQEVVVKTAGIRIVGLSDNSGARVILQNPGGVANGVTVRAGGDGFALVNVTLRGYDRNGILLSGIHDFLLSRVIAEDNGRYGLFPVMSSHGVIEHSSATGHSDAGIYVGQGEHITIRNSAAFGNVVGIEISNSSHVRLLASEAYDNTAGILVALLPGRRITTLSGILVAGNRAYNNNRPNFAEPGDLVGAVPAGAGILIVGADRTKVENNFVTGNEFIGIGVGSSVILAVLAGVSPDVLADLEPNPDGVSVRSNDVRGNGTASPLPLLPPADLFWDGSGSDNCWSGNQYATSLPPSLPACE